MSSSLRPPVRRLLPALLASLLLAGGCTSLRDALEADNVEYRNARRGPVLDVPPDLVSPRSDNRYTLPTQDQSQSLLDYNRARDDAEGEGQAARAGNVLPQSRVARIHRDGQVRWIVVDADPEAVWPVLLDFWAVQGFNLEQASPQLGIMETDWAERYQRVENSGVRGILSRKANAIYATGERDKYRTRLERTADGGTEVYLTYYGREEVLQGTNKDRSTWVPNNDNRPALETEYLQRMLARFAQAFGSRPLSGQVQKVPTTEVDEGAARQGRSQIVAADQAQGAQLRIAQDFERSWRDVGLVLDRLDFVIEDRNRERGVYDIRYVDPERIDQSQGTLSRIFSGERKDLSRQHYQLLVQGEGEQSTVSVRMGDGSLPQAEEDRRVAERLVRVLHENIR